MLSSQDDSITRLPGYVDNTLASVATPQFRMRPSQAPIITTQLPADTPLITKKLSMDAPSTTVRLPTLIPATEKRALISPPAPRRHRPVMLVGVLMSSVAVLTLISIFVTPLNSGQAHQSIGQGISNFISTGSLSSFNPSQQIAAPTPTQARLTNEGYCGGSDIWGSCANAVTDSGTMGTRQMQSPLAGAVITQVFANPEYQQWCGCWRPHTGIDLAASYGTPITAADSGQVIWTGWDWSGLGWAVKINHGHYIATIYGHLARFIVGVGQNVTKGDVIGYEGSSGASTGPHLHFMVLINNIWVNPAAYVQLP